MKKILGLFAQKKPVWIGLVAAVIGLVGAYENKEFIKDMTDKAVVLLSKVFTPAPAPGPTPPPPSPDELKQIVFVDQFMHRWNKVLVVANNGQKIFTEDGGLALDRRFCQSWIVVTVNGTTIKIQVTPDHEPQFVEIPRVVTPDQELSTEMPR
jgi:hypothetical protein